MTRSRKYNPRNQDYHVRFSRGGTFEISTYGKDGRKLYISPENREEIRITFSHLGPGVFYRNVFLDRAVKSIDLIVSGKSLDLK